MSKIDNIELISRLEAAIATLTEVSDENAEWEFPFSTFLWEVSDKGSFSIEKLFEFNLVSESEFLKAYIHCHRTRIC